MPSPTPLLKILETKLLTVLNPLVAATGDDKVRQIEVLPLNAAEELPNLLERHRSRMPGAFLSTPQIAAPKRPDRILELNLSYALMIGITARRETSARTDMAYAFFESAARELAHRDLNPVGSGVAAQLDFIRLTGWDFAEVEGANASLCSVSFLTFDLGVRNWRVN